MPRERKVREIDHGYQKVADGVLSRVDEKSRPAVAKILSEKRALKLYETLVEKGVPPRTIQDVMLDGIDDMAQDKEVSVGAYVKAVGEELLRHKGYRGAVDAMYEDHVLTARQYEEIVRDLDEKGPARVQELRGDLEGLARAAAWIMMILGVVLILYAGLGSVTGAVIGPSPAFVPLTFVIGFILFVIGLFLRKR
ncbi:MAG: hypothetical protein ABIH92_01440 [Nanoarchaeota archaeon]